ncbi:MAG: hypothetical protein PHD76_06360 [Methylacidiphilales bacterium]|nr:hypothetical protein [Candidatus Methylacidiphilales bacterium]
MTPDLQAALVCEDVRLEVSGSNTLVGVLNAIVAPAYPLRIMKLCVYTRWCSGQGEFLQTTRILAQDDEQELSRTETRFTLRGQDLHATNVAVFGGLEFKEPGDYPIEILLDGDLVLRFNLRAVKMEPPNQHS